MNTLQTTADVIAALGGNARMREITGAKSQQAVYNWQIRGCFPPSTFITITDALTAAGLRASPKLWRSVSVDALGRLADVLSASHSEDKQ